MKCCSRCRVEKPAHDFRAAPKKRDGLYPYCRDCSAAYQAEYRAANADKRRQWFVDNADRQKSRISQWQRENAGRRNAANALRYAAQKRATPQWANPEAMRGVYERAALLTKLSGVDFQVDHIVPLQGETVCGLHCEANLRVVTRSENASKKNRYWPEMPEPIEQTVLPPEMAATGANPGLV